MKNYINNLKNSKNDTERLISKKINELYVIKQELIKSPENEELKRKFLCLKSSITCDYTYLKDTLSELQRSGINCC